MNQLLLTLRFYATGNMLISVGEFAGIHKSTAGVIIRKVTREIALLRHLFVRFPDTDQGVRQIQEGFYRMNHFPRVLCAIDCTHVRLQSQGLFMTVPK